MPSLRICIVTPDIRGPIRNGGIGTACEAIAQVLAGAGHEITILYARGHYSEGSAIETWVDHYAARGIKLVPCPPAKTRAAPEHATTAWNVWRWLRSHPFDVIYAVEWGGTAFFAVLAKAQGLALRDTLIIVGTHSPTFWHLEGNRELPYQRHLLAVDHMERMSVGLADIVISPSQHLVEWFHNQQWSLPTQVRILPNPVPFYARKAQLPSDISFRIDEIVFFGRLEPRKGLILFAKALERMPADRLKRVRVTFLGKRTGFDAHGFLSKTLPGAVDWQLIDDRDAEQAISYLARPGRVAVIASLLENSPMTVVECIGRGIPFLASAVGGIPELLHADDRDRHLFAPHPTDLARALLDALSEGLTPARPLIDAGSIDAHWRALLRDLGKAASANRSRGDCEHQNAAAVRPAAATSTPSPEVSVVLVHHDRPKTLHHALDGLRRQTFREFEVILVDDGSDQEESKEILKILQKEFDQRGWKIIYQQNRYLGAARNIGWRAAKGRFILFHDDDNVALPSQLEILVAAIRHSGADILTSAMAIFSHADAPPTAWEQAADSVWTPIGGCLPLGLIENCFGDAQALVRRAVLEELGGFTEDYGLGHEDWELFARAVLAGYKLMVIPEPLFWYRLSPDSILRTRSEPDADYLRSARPYLELLPAPLRQVMLVALADERQRDAMAALSERAPDIKTRLVWYATHPDRIPHALRQATSLMRSGGLGALWAHLFAYKG